MSSSLSSIGGSRSAAAFGSGGSRAVQEGHPLARGCCGPCDTVFSTLQTAQDAARASIPRPVTSPRAAREHAGDPGHRDHDEVETGDIVRISAAGRLVKVEPEAPGEARAGADAAGADAARAEGERRPVFKALRSGGTRGGGRPLEDHEVREVEQLEQRDKEVRAHELAHKSAAGSHAGAVSLSYRTGPDGQRYAVAGEVPVDLSPVRGDPSATVRKMTQIRQAALAPADPSAADRAAASRATALMQKAQADLTELQAKRLEAARTGARPEDSTEGTADEGTDDAVEAAAAPDDTSGASGGGSAPEPAPQASTIIAAPAATELRFYTRG
jgi:hypothetical protein